MKIDAPSDAAAGRADPASSRVSSAAEFERQRARHARRTATRLQIDRVVAMVLPLVAWQLASGWIGKKWISSPVDVALRLWSMLLDGSLEMHSWETFKEAIIGLMIGVVLGAAIGIVLGLWRRLSDAVDPVVMGFYSLPRVSLAPLFIIWLGIGLVAKVALVASMVVFVVLFNVREGVRSIDREVVDAFRSMNASRTALLRHVIVPSLVPWLLTAIRIGIGMALVGAVVGEMIGASRGLGWYVNHTSGVYDMTGSITALVILVIMAMMFNGVLTLIERRVLHWRRNADAWIRN
ncbi:MAG: ABC transporter permease [Alphaproteobacteria bacterium]|nr:ABC transporter permease [Alphaproteobacteria bacterium]